MRLIDADALERKIMAMPDDELCEDCCYNVVNVISETPTVGGWISVKDRIPEPNKVVLVAVQGNGEFVHSAFVNTDWINKDGGWTFYSEEEVTHWLPLPETPKGKQE